MQHFINGKNLKEGKQATTIKADNETNLLPVVQGDLEIGAVRKLKEVRVMKLTQEG